MKKNEFGYVKWPEELNELLYDTHEGGMECWLAVGHERTGVRDVCITGTVLSFVGWDAIPSDETALDLFDTDDLPILDERPPMKRDDWPLVGAAICIGATRKSIFWRDTGNPWIPGLDDLTENGKLLFGAMKELYKLEPFFVMALDT